VANEPEKEGETEEDGGEFAEFLADVSHEIAQRVESLEPPPKAAVEEKKKTPIAPDPGIIVEWPDIADRMIEEMR
jgi:hypothetical protein